MNRKCSFTSCWCPAVRGSGAYYSFRYACEKLKVIYFDIPKNASTSIRRSLFGESEAASLVKPQLCAEDYFKFTFVRDPFARAVSNYLMFTKQPYRIKQMQEFEPNPQDMSFLDFLKFTIKIDNHHWQPQSEYIPEMKLDFIGRVENFKEDFNFVCDQLGHEQKGGTHLNQTSTGTYVDYYDADSLAIVSQKYAEDIKRFDYRFEG